MKKIIFSNPIKKPKIHFDKLKNNFIFKIFITILIIGIIFGAISGRNADELLMEKLDLIFLTNFKVRCSQGMLSAFSASFASNFLFLMTIFFLGLSLWGGYFSFIMPFIKGYGYGLSVGYLYNHYGFWGILYNLLMILPGAFLCSVMIAYASQKALMCSFRQTVFFLRTTVSDDIRQRMREYFKTMLILFLLSAVASSIDMLFSLCFHSIFKF